MSEEDYKEFWRHRPFKILGTYAVTENTDIPDRLEQLDNRKNEYFESEMGKLVRDTSSRFSETGSDLHFWATYKSWSFCIKCKLLHRQNLLPSFRNSKHSTVKNCICATGKYIVPQSVDIPLCLQGLNKAEVLALRPFVLHTGNYKIHQHGYRQKDGFCRVTWSVESVLEKVAKLEHSSYVKCMLAYRYLTTSELSKYNHFILLREEHIAQGTQLNMYDYRENSGIECALWPHLYPFYEWCETRLSGNKNRESAKVAFCYKLLSEVLDYVLDYDLLQFVYDRWLFNTVSGAISSARQFNTSAAASLSSKPFSIEYWRWQHRYLMDAVRQYGYPHLFVTVSPYEWTFPYAKWIGSAAELSGRGPTKLASLETLHIVHVLEQTVRGFLCGTNSKRWQHHVFNYDHQRNHNNVKNFFYRIEFQGRGTAHIHVLIWLEDLSKSSYDEINAHIPLDDKELSFLVYDLQQSHKTVLNLNENATSLKIHDQGKYQLKLYYPQTAFMLNLRTYISSLLPFLKCRMDVQFSDQCGMLMRYVSNYVSKFKDSQSTESLYSVHLSPALAAYRHLRDMKPSEPEMIMTLSSIKVAWSSNSTKRYSPPTPCNASANVILSKYYERGNELNITLLQFLRTHDTLKVKPVLYKRQTCLVGIKYVSYFNCDFFFQFLLMNIVHWKLDDLKHPNHDILPENLKYFASCMVNLPDIFHSVNMRKILEKEGHKSYFIDNVVNYIENMKNVYHLWQIQVLSNEDFTAFNDHEIDDQNLDPTQYLVLGTLKQFLSLRTSYYSEFGNFDIQLPSADGNLFEHHEWTKVISITGKPGTGKTKTLHSCIKYLLTQELKCLVATPTGYLASSYRAVFDNSIDTNTIHSSFHISIDNAPAQINWALSVFDVIIIDEASMVSLENFRHIMCTLQELATRPIFVISGDKYQLPPIISVSNKTTVTTSIYEHPGFSTLCRNFNLTRQYRCVDEEYSEILNHLRFWKPTDHILHVLQNDRVLHPSDAVSDTELLHIISENLESTFLTISRRGVKRINDLILQNIFKCTLPIGNIQMDNDDALCSIYKGMRIVITQNRDKTNGIVNGQPATILMRENMSILIQLPNGKKVSVYPVTTCSKEPDDGDNDRNVYKTVYPFVPGYAMTICKSQGQTLTNIIVWFDCNVAGTGCAYVALSRVKRLQDIKFLTPLKMTYFQPAHF